jgi:hypothetical protein
MADNREHGSTHVLSMQQVLSTVTNMATNSHETAIPELAVARSGRTHQNLPLGIGARLGPLRITMYRDTIVVKSCHTQQLCPSSHIHCASTQLAGTWVRPPIASRFSFTILTSVVYRWQWLLLMHDGKLPAASSHPQPC